MSHKCLLFLMWLLKMSYKAKSDMMLTLQSSKLSEIKLICHMFNCNAEKRQRKNKVSSMLQEMTNMSTLGN